MNTRNITAAYLVIQASLLFFGFWQVQQESQIMVAFGLFNIVVNIAAGALNIKNLINA